MKTSSFSKTEMVYRYGVLSSSSLTRILNDESVTLMTISRLINFLGIGKLSDIFMIIDDEDTDSFNDLLYQKMDERDLPIEEQMILIDRYNQISGDQINENELNVIEILQKALLNDGYSQIEADAIVAGFLEKALERIR